MKSKLIKYLIISILLICIGASSKTINPLLPTGFVYISESYIIEKGDTLRVGAFEIMDHPVTNKEYVKFIEATNHRAPEHWLNGKVPKGYEDYPVIFINREDAYQYTEWLSKIDNRIYRLPTSQHYLIAGRKDESRKYFWGNDESLINDENINYDKDGNRNYNDWKRYLKPAKWGMKNDKGIYGISGNVWQITTFHPDPEIRKWYFRIENEFDYDRVNLVGGSWARSEKYLALNEIQYRPSGIKSPDVGIRLIREPENVKWKVIPRRIVAINTNGNVAVSWAILDSDSKNTGFNVYRLKSNNRDTDGVKINSTPLVNSSFFLDSDNIVNGSRYQYRVVPIDKNGVEGNPSEWAGITVDSSKISEIISFSPLYQLPGLVPVFGNLEGNGRLGCVIRLANGCVEMSQDPGFPVQLEAFSSFGKPLWRKDVARHSNIYGNANNCPFNVWDMDNDGKAEVITFLQIEDENYLAILDGLTGKIKNKTRWPKMATDNVRSSTRQQISVGYLDGKKPAIITQTGIYENEIITAYDVKLNTLWTYESFGATSGTGGHKIEIADVDGDGKQEVIYGTTCLNSDGTLRWSIYRGHPDIISIQDYIPENPGLEVFYAVETNMHSGIYLVDANSGRIIWKNNQDDDSRWFHAHFGWAADILGDSPGKEFVVTRTGHSDSHYAVFDSKGNIIQEAFPPKLLPIEWDGDNTRELIGENGRIIGKWNGREVIWMKGTVPNPIPNSRFLFSADLYGDFRDELIIVAEENGKEVIKVLGAISEISNKYISPFEDINYKLWLARNYGGGYPSIFDNPYIKPN